MQKRKFTFQRKDYPLPQHTDFPKVKCKVCFGVQCPCTDPRGMRGSTLWTREFPCNGAEQVLIPHMSPVGTHGPQVHEGPQVRSHPVRVQWAGRQGSEARIWLIRSHCLLRMRTPVGHRGGHSRGHRHRLCVTCGGQEGPGQGLASREKGMKERLGTGSSSSFCPNW